MFVCRELHHSSENNNIMVTEEADHNCGNAGQNLTFVYMFLVILELLVESKQIACIKWRIELYPANRAFTSTDAIFVTWCIVVY
jgi:hypothetical protein